MGGNSGQVRVRPTLFEILNNYAAWVWLGYDGEYTRLLLQEASSYLDVPWPLWLLTDDFRY